MLSFPLAQAPPAAPSETTGLLSSYLLIFDYTLIESKPQTFSNNSDSQKTNKQLGMEFKWYGYRNTTTLALSRCEFNAPER